MKRTLRRLSVCPRCNGVGKFSMYDQITEEVHPEDCTLCKGISIVLETTTIEHTAVTEQDLKNMREVKHIPITNQWT